MALSFRITSPSQRSIHVSTQCNIAQEARNSPSGSQAPCSSQSPPLLGAPGLWCANPRALKPAWLGRHRGRPPCRWDGGIQPQPAAPSPSAGPSPNAAPSLQPPPRRRASHRPESAGCSASGCPWGQGSEVRGCNQGQQQKRFTLLPKGASLNHT